MIKSELRNSYEYATQEDRCSARARVSISATMRPAGGKRLQTVIRDISLSGFSAIAISRLAQGTCCWLTLPGHEPLRANVVWWEQGRVGCAFEQLLEQSVHDQIVSSEG